MQEMLLNVLLQHHHTRVVPVCVSYTQDVMAIVAVSEGLAYPVCAALSLLAGCS
jgi:hypothetical protein